MKLVLDLGSPVPAYRQIVDQIRPYLVAGTLKPGDKLPSVRRLGIDLAIHHNTVAEAYRTLAAEGWLEVAAGKSARVVPRTAEPRKRSDLRREHDGFARRLRNLIAEMRSHGLPEDWIQKELLALSGEKEKQ
jgi:DNA-binding transcriptional regulator YhcF (GntR family)